MQIVSIADRGAAGAGLHYERMLAAIGTPRFGSTVRQALSAETGRVRRLYLFEATGRTASDLHYSFCEPELRELFPVYSKLYLPLDPVGDAYRSTPRQGDMVLQRVQPADIASAGFRRCIFDEPRIAERATVVQRGEDSWRAISVARHRSDGCFSDAEVSAIVALACLALPMLPLNRRRARCAGPPTVAQLEERFAEVCPQLTPRQAEVCARAAIGMTVEATALDLAIARTSVLTHRKRAYQRLGVTSPFELSALVWH
jgi:DNA-binding CsgD family transcriptional regulator